MKNCHKGRCQNDQGASPYFDIGVTGLALLAFVRHGNTHRKGKYKDTVKAAVEFLLRNQDKEGWIGRISVTHEWVYNHTIATMALCELLAASEDTKWKRLIKARRKAVECIVKAQNRGLGWRYTPAGGDNDTSVTGWMVLALKRAEQAGVRIAKVVWEGALKWFDRCTDPATGRVGYKNPGDLGSVIRGVNDRKWEKLPAMTGVAVLCRLLCGQERSDPRVKKSVEFLTNHLPTWDAKGSKVDMYYWYYGTYALFHHGGAEWKKWNEALKEALLHNQCKDGCKRGSWDPIGKWGMVGGRVYSTALCALMLEVYYYE